MKNTLLTLAIIALLCSCGDFLLSEDYRGGDWFYLENKGATMPVWVNGNKQSKTFVIFLHGGPGGSSMNLSTLPAFKELEKDYAFVYWDQRGSGTSQGNAQPDSFSLEQFVEDLEKLVILIRYKYNKPTIFLMGGSWGGTLGTGFLINPKNQTYISGWIEVSGSHNYHRDMLLSIEWAIGKAEENIAGGKDVGYWEKELAWSISKRPFSISDMKNKDNGERHVNNLNKLNGYFYNPANEPDTPISLFFNTPYSFSLLLNQLSLPTDFMFRFDLVPEMQNIQIPSLILWGRHDGILTVELAEEAYNAIGSDNKYLYIFEQSAHNVPIEEPDLFVDRVRAFVNEYK